MGKNGIYKGNYEQREAGGEGDIFFFYAYYNEGEVRGDPISYVDACDLANTAGSIITNGRDQDTWGVAPFRRAEKRWGKISKEAENFDVEKACLEYGVLKKLEQELNLYKIKARKLRHVLMILNQHSTPLFDNVIKSLIKDQQREDIEISIIERRIVDWKLNKS